jgi:hypothetical protein
MLASQITRTHVPALDHENCDTEGYPRDDKPPYRFDSDLRGPLNVTSLLAGHFKIPGVQT